MPEGRETTPGRWRASATAVAALLVPALSYATYRQLRDTESRRIRAEFRADAEDRARAIELAFATQVEALLALRSFYEGSRSVEREEFDAFTRSARARHHSVLQALLWAERAADDTFPVAFVEPEEGNEDRLGGNLGAEPACRAALVAARDRAAPRVARVRLADGGQGMLFVAAVYRNGTDWDTPEGRRGNLQGFVASVVRVAGVVDEALGRFGKGEVALRLLDPAAPPGQREMCAAGQPDPDGGDGWFEDARPVAGRDLVVVCSPVAGYVADRRTFAPQSIGIALAVVGLGAVAYFLLLRRRAERVERLVEERTADLREASRAAEEANRAKSRFLANMSHELRTPLTAILGYGEMLEEEAHARGEARMAADLRRLQDAGRLLLSLINDVLDLAKVEAGRIVLDRQAVDVDALVREVGTTVAPLVQANGNAFRVDVAPAAGRMTTDPTRLRQVLINLLSNAGKFTERGSVTLAVSRDGGDVVFEVSDTGIGMTPDQLARVFHPFAQADESTTRRFGGTGLGLAISDQFAALLGGFLAARSVVGEGSTFTLRLPATPGGGARLPARAASAAGG